MPGLRRKSTTSSVCGRSPEHSGEASDQPGVPRDHTIVDSEGVAEPIDILLSHVLSQYWLIYLFSIPWRLVSRCSDRQVDLCKSRAVHNCTALFLLYRIELHGIPNPPVTLLRRRLASKGSERRDPLWLESPQSFVRRHAHSMWTTPRFVGAQSAM